MTPTDWQRLLDVLSDGKPHSHRELYRLGMVVHSRISDLRKRGYVIESWRTDLSGRWALVTTYWYQLIGALPEQSEVEAGEKTGPPAAHAGEHVSSLCSGSATRSTPSSSSAQVDANGRAPSEESLDLLSDSEVRSVPARSGLVDQIGAETLFENRRRELWA